jgi:hypothetical protein
VTLIFILTELTTRILFNFGLSSIAMVCTYMKQGLHTVWVAFLTSSSRMMSRLRCQLRYMMLACLIIIYYNGQFRASGRRLSSSLAEKILGRPWHLLDIDLFRDALMTSKLHQPEMWPDDIDDLAKLYDSEIIVILDRLIPSRWITRRPRPSDPLFDAECRREKCITRRLERLSAATARRATASLLLPVTRMLLALLMPLLSRINGILSGDVINSCFAQNVSSIGWGWSRPIKARQRNCGRHLISY